MEKEQINCDVSFDWEKPQFRKDLKETLKKKEVQATIEIYETHIAFVFNGRRYCIWEK